MEYEEIKKLSDAELAEKISGERIMFGKLKLQHGVSPIENPMRVRAQRKLVARLLTEFNARKKPAAPASPKAAAVPAPVKTAAPKAAATRSKSAGAKKTKAASAEKKTKK
jgi:large subunit ribosomal protein L29